MPLFSQSSSGAAVSIWVAVRKVYSLGSTSSPRAEASEHLRAAVADACVTGRRADRRRRSAACSGCRRARCRPAGRSASRRSRPGRSLPLSSAPVNVPPVNGTIRRRPWVVSPRSSGCSDGGLQTVDPGQVRIRKHVGHHAQPRSSCWPPSTSKVAPVRASLIMRWAASAATSSGRPRGGSGGARAARRGACRGRRRAAEPRAGCRRSRRRSGSRVPARSRAQGS